MRGWAAVPAVLGALLLAGCSTAAPRASSATPTDIPPMTDSPNPTPSPSNTPTPTPTPASQPEPPLLLVTAFADAHLVLVDPEAGEAARIEVGRAPWGVAVAPDGMAYVATLDGLAIVDVPARERIGLIPYEAGLEAEPVGGEYRPGGLGIAVSPDGD